MHACQALAKIRVFANVPKPVTSALGTEAITLPIMKVSIINCHRHLYS